MFPEPVQEAGAPLTDLLPRVLGVPGHLAVRPAEARHDRAHTDAGASAQVSTALRVEAGGSPQLFSVEGKCLLRVSAERKSSLLETRLLLRLDQPPVDRSHRLLLSALLTLGRRALPV